MKHMKLLSLLLALAMAASLMVGCGAASSETTTDDVPVVESDLSGAEEAVVHSTLTVTYADGTEKEIALECQEGESLAKAMLTAGLISEEEAESGFITVIDGQEAKWEPDAAFWALTDSEGNMTSVGAGEIILAEGDSYGFTYTVSE